MDLGLVAPFSDDFKMGLAKMRPDLHFLHNARALQSPHEEVEHFLRFVVFSESAQGISRDDFHREEETAGRGRVLGLLEASGPNCAKNVFQRLRNEVTIVATAQFQRVVRELVETAGGIHEHVQWEFLQPTEKPQLVGL